MITPEPWSSMPGRSARSSRTAGNRFRSSARGHDRRTRLTQPQDDRLAEPSGAARDQRTPAVELEIHLGVHIGSNRLCGRPAVEVVERAEVQDDGEISGRHDVRPHPPLGWRVGGGNEHHGVAAFVGEQLVVIEAAVRVGDRPTEETERLVELGHGIVVPGVELVRSTVARIAAVTIDGTVRYSIASVQAGGRDNRPPRVRACPGRGSDGLPGRWTPAPWSSSGSRSGGRHERAREAPPRGSGAAS
jgi:hypothetical protein